MIQKFEILKRKDYLKESNNTENVSKAKYLLSRDEFLLDESVNKQYRVSNPVSYFDKRTVRIYPKDGIVKSYEDFRK